MKTAILLFLLAIVAILLQRSGRVIMAMVVYVVFFAVVFSMDAEAMVWMVVLAAIMWMLRFASWLFLGL